MTFIAQFIDTSVFGGAEAIAVNLCERFNGQGFSTVVFHFGNPEMEEYCRLHKVSHFVLPTLKEYRSWKTLPLFAWKFAQTLHIQGVQLLHSHLFGAVIGGSLASRFANIPHVGTLHDVYTLEESTLRIRALQLSAFLGTRLVTVAHFLEEYCKERATFFPPSRLRTIVNGVPPTTFSLDEKKALRENFGFASDETIFVSVGRLVPLKRHDLLLQSFAKLQNQLNAKLMIIGDGPERSTLHTLAESLGISARVTFTGYRHDVKRFLAASDSFILLSKTECLSCSILEAMAEGLPVLCTDVGGNHELVEDGVNGFFCQANPADISEKMAYLIEHSWKRDEISRSSKRRFEERFSINKMAEGYLALYGELL